MERLTKTQWVKQNLPEEFKGCFGEVLAVMLMVWKSVKFLGSSVGL
jgi:hypothetical protein